MRYNNDKKHSTSKKSSAEEKIRYSSEDNRIKYHIISRFKFQATSFQKVLYHDEPAEM